MKKTLKALSSFAILVAISLIFISCDKEFNSIDSDVLGKDNANFFTDTLKIDVLAYNRTLDAVQVNGLNSNLLGVYNDDIYGQTTASIVTQIIPTTFNPDFGTDPKIDSVMLNIPFFSRVMGTDNTGNATYEMTKRDSLYVFGNGTINLSIYRNNYLLRNFNPNSETPGTQNYYSFAENTPDPSNNYALIESGAINFDAFIGEEIFNEEYKPSSEAVEILNGEESIFSPPALRIELDKMFWKTAILDKQGSAELSNASNFVNYLRGLYIKAEAINATDGYMQLLNLGSSNANIVIYYNKQSATDANQRTSATYTLNFSGIRLNTFINHFTPPLENGNTANGDEILNLKGMAGSMAVVDLFGGTDLQAQRNFFVDNTDPDNPVKRRLINEARLIIYEDETLADEDHQYDRLYAYDIKNSTPLLDYNFDGTGNTVSPFNSKVIHLSQRDTLGAENRGYIIRVTEHVKNIIYNDSTNTKVGLTVSNNVNYITNAKILNSPDEVDNVPASTMITTRGTRIYGNNTASFKRMRLKIYYTEPTN